MHCGVSLFFQNFPDFDRVLAGAYDRASTVPDAEVYRDTLRLGDLVEPLGFDSLWTVEHHFSPYAMTANPLQLLSYFAGRTRRVGLGTMVIVAPWHDPVRIAEEICVLDNLAGGRRLSLGFGRGAAAREFAGMRVNQDESRERWEESLDIVRLALTRECFSFDGRHHRLVDLTVRPRPCSSDLTERMFCAWSSEESLQFAAEGGFGQLFISLQSWEHAAESSRAFNRIRALRGWAPVDPISVVFVSCCERRDQIRSGEAYLAEMMDASIHHYDLLAGVRTQTPGASDDGLVEMLRSNFIGLNVVGSPDECVAKLRQIHDTVHCAEFICVFHCGRMPASEGERSMRLFAREVLPEVHAWPGSDPRSVPYQSVVGTDRRVALPSR